MNRPIVENKIAEVLKLHPKGSVFFVDDFLYYGNSESVKKALLRLKEKEILLNFSCPDLWDNSQPLMGMRGLANSMG